MKANHNDGEEGELKSPVVVNISKSKNESKSQQRGSVKKNKFVVVNISKSKNESKSQHRMGCSFSFFSCGKYQ